MRRFYCRQTATKSRLDRCICGATLSAPNTCRRIAQPKSLVKAALAKNGARMGIDFYSVGQNPAVLYLLSTFAFGRRDSVVLPAANSTAVSRSGAPIRDGRQSVLRARATISPGILLTHGSVAQKLSMPSILAVSINRTCFPPTARRRL
jgi:hypothetical protein